MGNKKGIKKLDKRVKWTRGQVSKFFQDNTGIVANHKQISAALRLVDATDKQILIAVLEAMVKENLLKEERRGKFRWTGPLNLLQGTILFNRSGTAYVAIPGKEQDVLIPENMSGNALHEDLVTIQMLPARKSGRPKGRVVEILERAREQFPGIIQLNPKFAFVVPDNPKINVDFFIPLTKLNGAKDGQKVVVRFLEWPAKAVNPIAEVTDVLGMPGEHRAESDSILAEFGFPLRFPSNVEEDAAAIPIEIPAEEIKKRRDFRNILTFTIDPEDAKDFDDALSFQQLANGNYEIGVHIADVTHYVDENSDIEKEAVARATSVYLVDRVIPMLPEVLSNNLCSLRPQEEKLTFSAVFEMDPKGNVVDSWLGKTVIFSDHRFAYEDVQTILESGKGIYSEELSIFNSFAKKLRAQRMKKGAIAFEKIEVKFRLDDEKQPIDVLFKIQKDAHKLIEEFMLLANRTVAEFIGKKTQKDQQIKTFVYRIHDRPDPMKLQDFSNFIKRFGFSVDLNTPDKISQSINKLLAEVKGKPEENVISHMAIRSMAKAEYSTENIGHFGLGFSHYSHFTSPIRRYPDMMAHRLLFQYLNGASSAKQELYDRKSKHSSLMERKAVDAERESTKYYQVLYLKNAEGNEFEGVVSGVTEWGIYVEITANKCEGMVRLRDIEGDFYYYDEKNFCVTGQRTKRSLSLGQTVKVRVESADLINRRIDLKLI